MPTHGIPNPTIRLGALVLNANLRPAVMVDDEVQSPIRKIRLEGRVVSVWASDIVGVDNDEFELALALSFLEKPYAKDISVSRRTSVSKSV